MSNTAKEEMMTREDGVELVPVGRGSYILRDTSHGPVKFYHPSTKTWVSSRHVNFIHFNELEVGKAVGLALLESAPSPD